MTPAQSKKAQLCSKCQTPIAMGLKRKTKHIYRRAFSETRLLEILERDFTPGASYHCISAGDIDSLSYLKFVIHQQPLDYLLFSTWCMATEDILQLDEWIDAGKIKRLDAYAGEIFQASYSEQFDRLKPVVRKTGGWVAVFRNHTKIYAGIGKKFAFAIESSANINTNPRAENTVITVGMDGFEFYKAYFDKIISFNREFDTWKPWKIPDKTKAKHAAKGTG